MKEPRGDHRQGQPCDDCAAPTAGDCQYRIEGDETIRCWVCHCTKLGVWSQSEGRPTAALDREGRVVE